MATTTSYAVSNALREDLLDVVVNTDPTETPFVSRAAKVPARSRVHDWLNDTHATPTTGAEVEGSSASFTARGQFERTTNYTHIARVPFSVSDSDEAFNMAGMRSLFEFEMQKALRQLGRKMEIICWQSTSSSGTAALARSLGGILQLTTSNTGTPAASASGWQYSDHISLLSKIWTNGGNPDILYCQSPLKQDVSNFTANNTRFISAEGTDVRLNAAVDVLVTDYGSHAVVLDRWLPTESGEVMEHDKWRLAFARPVHFRPTAYLGGSRDGKVEVEFTLEALSQKTAGKITGVQDL